MPTSLAAGSTAETTTHWCFPPYPRTYSGGGAVHRDVSLTLPAANALQELLAPNVLSCLFSHIQKLALFWSLQASAPLVLLSWRFICFRYSDLVIWGSWANSVLSYFHTISNCKTINKLLHSKILTKSCIHFLQVHLLYCYQNLNLQPVTFINQSINHQWDCISPINVVLQWRISIQLHIFRVFWRPFISYFRVQLVRIVT